MCWQDFLCAEAETVAPVEVVVAACLNSSVSGCVLIALGKQQSRKDGVHDNGEPGGRLEDAGPLLQVSRTWTRCGEAWLSGN